MSNKIRIYRTMSNKIRICHKIRICRTLSNKIRICRTLSNKIRIIMQEMSHKIRICRTKSHKIRTKLQYAGQYPTKLEYCMARIFRGIQFLQKAHLQRFRDLIFADGRFRVAPPTIPLGSASYCTCAAAQISLELVEKSYEKSASDRSYLYFNSGGREMARELHMIQG